MSVGVTVTGATLAASVALGGALYARLTDTLDQNVQTLREVSQVVARHDEAIDTLKFYVLEPLK